eukprot:1778722-Rhodomonas_salina.3
MTYLVNTTEQYESSGCLLPGWHFQDCLPVAAINDSALILGVPLLGLSPSIEHGWQDLDTECWSKQQWEQFRNAPAGVVFLHAPLEFQQ